MAIDQKRYVSKITMVSCFLNVVVESLMIKNSVNLTLSLGIYDVDATRKLFERRSVIFILI